MTPTRTDWLAPLASTGSLKQRGFNSLVWLLASQAGRLLTLLVSTMLLVRLLPPSDFGLVAMAATITALMLAFKDAGMTTATMQQTTLTHPQVSTLFWLNQGVAVGLAGLTALLAQPLAWFYGQPTLVPVVLLLALGFVVSGVGVQHDALLRRAMRFKALAVLEVTSTLLSVLVAVGLAWQGAGWVALVLQRVLQLMFYSAGCWALCSWRPSPLWQWGSSKAQAGFGAQISAFNAVNYFARNGDNILIGWYWGPALLGVYAKAYDTLLAPLQQLAGPLNNTLLPLLARLRNEPTRYRAAFLRAYTPAMLLLLPVGLVLSVLPQAVVATVFGPSPAWQPAVPVLGWLGLAVATQLVGTATGTLLLSQQRGSDFAIQGVVGAVLSVTSFAIGLPHGIGAVAGCYVIMHIVLWQPLLCWWVGRTGPVGFRPLYGLLALPAWCGVWVGLGLFGVRFISSGWAPWFTVLVGCVVATLLTLAATLALPKGRAMFIEVLTLLPAKAIPRALQPWLKHLTSKA